MAGEENTTSNGKTTGEAVDGKQTGSRPKRPEDVTAPPPGATRPAVKNDKGTNIQTKDLKDSD